MTKIILSAIGYALVVFPLAFVWHLVLFEPSYRAFGYFEGTPNVLLGFVTIIIQGTALSILFPHFEFGQNTGARVIRFAFLIGAFFWTSHVLALVAKQHVPDAGTFILMESGYLFLQFGLFACVLWVLYRKETNG